MLTLRGLLSRRFQIVLKIYHLVLLKMFLLLIINFVIVATNYFIMLHMFPADLEINTWMSFFHIQKCLILHHVMQ